MNATTEEMRELRVSLNLSKASFAALLGIAASTVTRWESGRSAPRLTLKEIERKVLAGKQYITHQEKARADDQVIAFSVPRLTQWACKHNITTEQLNELFNGKDKS